MYPIVVTCFDSSAEQISVKLLSLPIIEKNSPGENIANLIIQDFKKCNIPFENCIALGSDNTKVMIGNKKGAYAFLKKEHDNLVVFGCLCHLLNLAEKGSATLPISTEELIIDIYYLRKSVKRQRGLKKFQNLYSSDEQKILKHCVTQWLSLGKSLSPVLDHWNALLFYFKSECKVGDVNKDKKQSQKRKAENLPKLAKKQKVDLKSSFVQVRDPSPKSKLNKPESCAKINNSEIMQVSHKQYHTSMFHATFP